MSKPASGLLLGAPEAAELLGVSRAHIYRLHNTAQIPQPVRLGGAVRWRREELQAWVRAGAPVRRTWEAMRGKGGGR